MSKVEEQSCENPVCRQFRNWQAREIDKLRGLLKRCVPLLTSLNDPDDDEIIEPLLEEIRGLNE